MFSVLLASVTAILVVLLQKLKLPQKHILVLIYIMAGFFLVMVLALIMENTLSVKHEPAKPVTGSIGTENTFSDLQKEEIKENIKEVVEQYGTIIPEKTEELYFHFRKRFNEWEFNQPLWAGN